MKKTYMTLLLAAVALLASAAAPNGSGTYYQNANGKKGAQLKTALCGIIYNRTEKSYDYLWTAFRTTDKRSDGKVWDMYSSITKFTFGTDQAGNYQKEGDVYNREHSFPKSWFGGEVMPMYSDLHHMYPTDGYVNNMRGNLPFGKVSNPTYSSSGGFSKVGPCSYSGYTGKVFEPADEYKGDFARTYFYMVTCYEEKLADWYSKNSESQATIDGTKYPAFQSWQLNMLMEWATNDPVSEKEINRNNAVYGIQNNRNPFIDYPGLEQYIWGNKKDVAFDYDDYVQPDGSSSGSGTGGDPDPGTDPNPGGSGTYKLTITPAYFNGSSYASNNNEKTSQAVCTTDANKTYEVKWTSNKVMLQSGHMQWQKGAGYIYNSTDLGTITSVTVTSSAGTFTTYYGTSEQPSSSTTPGGGYFKTVVGNDDTGNTSKIEVVFSLGGDEPVDPTFNNLSDLSVNWETPLTLTQGTTGTPNFLTDGTVTLTSLNESVATVDGLVIKPHAVGTAMISVSTAATDAYNAGSVMFPITVNAPEGKTTAAPTQSGLLFGETFGDNSGSARAWNDSYSVKSGVSDVYSGITGYTITEAKQSKNNSGSTASGLMSTQGTEASIIIGPLNVADYSGLTLTYQWKASSVSATYYSKAYYATSSTGTYTELIGTGTGATTFVERSYTLPASAQVGTLYLKIVWKTSNANGFIDEVQLSGTSAGTLTKTLNDYGYASYCSEYPLDFSDYESAGYSAWQVTGVSGETINFAQVTGKVKGGTGLILKGEPGETVTLHSANSTTTLDDNLLVGTIVKTYAETGQYFGLKDKAFVPVAESTVPAGKALLPASLITSNEVKALNFVFEEDATGISLMEDGRSQMEDGVIYKQGSTIVNLAGQRLDNSQLKRGIYIVNGKKIMVK